jgi:hypothetical protein
MANHGPLHWVVVKRIFHYLKHSSTWRIFYFIGSKQEFPQGWKDADWVGDLKFCKSTSCMFSYLVGGQYHGKLESKHQSFSHLLNSSIYMLLQLQKKPCGFVNYSMIFKQSKPLSLHCDNQSCTALTLNP